MRVVLLLATLSLLPTSSAFAQTPAPVAAGMQPHAFVFCKIGITRAASRCEPMGEAPADRGLGAAAVKAVEGSKPAVAKEFSVAGGALVAVCFDLSGAAPVVSGAGEACGVAPVVYTAVDVVVGPSEAQIQKAYPERADEAGISGRGTLSCAVDSVGKLHGCAVTAVAPQGESFDTMTLSLAGFFVLRPKVVDGAARAGVVTLPLRFDPNGRR